MTKVAIVTASGTGMGAEAARKLAKDGYKIGILSSSGKGSLMTFRNFRTSYSSTSAQLPQG